MKLGLVHSCEAVSLRNKPNCVPLLRVGLVLLREAMLVVGDIAESSFRLVALETVWLGRDCARMELGLLGGRLLSGPSVCVVSARSNVGFVLSG